MSGQRIGIGQAAARASDPILLTDALLAKVDDSITRAWAWPCYPG